VIALAASAAMAIVLGNVPASASATVAGVINTEGTPLNVRAAASTSAAVVGSLANGATVALVCQVAGPSVQGTVRTTSSWDKTTGGRYVSDAYVRRGAIGACTSNPAGSLPGQAKPGTSTGWVKPVPGKPGQRFRPVSNPYHDGVDIMEPRSTPIHAANAGSVVTVTCNTSGLSCDVDGSPSVRGCGWYVEIQHVSQVITRYCHMVKRPSVTVGQKVISGQVIGYVGTSGNSSGTHLHFEVHIGPGYAQSANAVDPVAFMQRENAPLGG
jgi:murein DD-endopeptidase MepM/ murein hydrolase activator NlpD